ncbi:GNAT family N-acetyltransferase [Streptomyces sp. NPDC041068]|uniref:GNAT family N-acetyltransferase n=1 Tax=Streptomyces sp. NPDC041068 TaxID=3155130 RepID=UPI0033D235A4
MTAPAEPRETTAVFTLRPLDPLTDCELVHDWVTRPESAFWLMQNAKLPDVERAYMAIAAADHRDAFLGLHAGVPSFLVERYDPSYAELVGLYDPLPGDVGMRLLALPSEVRFPVPGFTLGALTAAVRELFADPATERVVIDPDLRDTTAHVLLEAVGFRAETVVQKPEKQALLSFCTRERFAAA